MKSRVVYAAILFTHICKIWDKDLTEYQVYISLQIFKKPLDIFSPQIERTRSKEFLVIMLAVNVNRVRLWKSKHREAGLKQKLQL